MAHYAYLVTVVLPEGHTETYTGFWKALSVTRAVEMAVQHISGISPNAVILKLEVIYIGQ